MVTAVLLLAVQAQSKEYDPFMALGRMRADFGEKWIEANGYEAWIWNTRRMVFEGSTVMLFPEGAFDRRLYLQAVSSVGEDWLVLETRHYKAGSNAVEISFDWKIKLEPTDREAVPDLDHGTLERMLHLRGLRAPATVPEAAELTLKAKKGFAAYNIQPAPGFYLFSYWYVQPDGTTVDYVRSYEPPWPEYTGDFGTPVTAFPYPVTQSEKASLTRQGWTFKAPGEK